MSFTQDTRFTRYADLAGAGATDMALLNWKTLEMTSWFGMVVKITRV